MVLCCVIDCSNRSDPRRGHSTSNGTSKVPLYRLPKVTERYGKADFELRKKRLTGFLSAISRDDINPSTLDEHDYRVCSRHFLSGEPADLYDVNNPDWLPTLHMGHSKGTGSSHDAARYERGKERERKKVAWEAIVEEVKIIVTDLVEVVTEEECTRLCAEQIEIGLQYVKVDRPTGKSECDCSKSVKELQDQLADCTKTIDELSEQVTAGTPLPPFCEKSFVSDDFTLTHTGLPNFKVLKAIFNHVSKTLPSDGVTKLSHFQEFVCVLLKLKTDLPNKLLAYNFGVSASTISRIILKWLTQMDIRLKGLIMWPDRDSLRKTMPACFQKLFRKKVAVIIDCFEVFIERPSNLQARAMTWSNYKHHNTIKVLMGITPQGVISFISESWGGRVSDKYLTEHCGFLKKLLPGDIVLADRGFDIADSVGVMQAALHIPAFTKGKSQLSAEEIEQTRTIANVLIHVERVIGSVRQKFKILQSTLPIHFLITRKGEDTPLIDRIIRVCCALNNICDSVVPFD